MAEPWTKTARWTDAQCDQIAGYLVAGHSASQIGSLMDVSRNAIIGLVSRNPKLKEIGFARVGNGGREKGGLRVAKPIKRRNPVRKKVRAVPALVAELDLPTERVRFTAEPAVAGIPLLMFSPRRCKWPVNDAEPNAGHLFCGEATNGNRYCACHMALAYRSRETKLMAAE